MEADAGKALDSVDRFVEVGRELAAVTELSEPKHAEALESLIEVVQTLLGANENMARWLNSFTHFDFRAGDARRRFLDLISKFKTAKAGPEFHQMKWPCGEIQLIYNSQIRPDMTGLLVQNEPTRERLETAFQGLGTADDDMVGFIYETVVGGVESFISAAEPSADSDDLDAAEQARIEFKARAAHLSERLERLGGGLSELLLDFGRLSGKPIKLRR